MSNAASRQLFAALLPLLAVEHTTTLYPEAHQQNATHQGFCPDSKGAVFSYRERDLWCVTHHSEQFLIGSPDQTFWTVSPIVEDQFMNTPVHLNRPALTSASDSGLQIHTEALLTPSENAPLTFSDQWVKGKMHAFGAIEETLTPLLDNIPEAHRSRNNQLILHALSQIDGLIQTAITRYGKERVAVITGTSTSDTDENIPLSQHVVQGDAWTNIPFKRLQHAMASPSESIAQVYGLDGLRYTASTAYASGARALISAAQLLHTGLCDAVVCGGVDTLSPLTVNDFTSLEVLSDDVARPFSANRNDVNIGEAATFFVITRDADFDGEVQLLGRDASSDAHRMSSPRPGSLGAAQSFQAALDKAGLKAEDIGWVNLYGTDTQHNDSMEGRAVAEVSGSYTLCTSTKPSTGHTLSATDAIEATFTWLVVNRQYNPEGRLPPQQ